MDMTWIEAFHFLRPHWLWALIVVAFLCWRLVKQKQQQGAWQNVIDPAFQRVLLPQDASGSPNPAWSIWGVAALGFMGSLMVLALAGPSWQQVNLPVQKPRQATVIVLDLSLSMLADDVQPNRLTRVRYKLNDYINQHPQVPMGMVGYAGSAHIITPISQDNAPMLSLLPTLNPLMMPHFGSEPLLAMQQAHNLLAGAHIETGQIVWITDDLEPEQLAPLRTYLNGLPYQLNILMVGTERGGPVAIPQQGLLKDEAGNIVLPKLPSQRLLELAQQTHASISGLTADNADLRTLAPHWLAASKQAKTTQPEANEKHQAWLDEGAVLLWLLLPLVALSFRRGWVFGSLLLPGGLLFLAMEATPVAVFANSSNTNNTGGVPTTENVSFWDAFKTPDHLGYERWQQQDYAGAQAQFESTDWQAASLYKMGRYQEAADLYAQDDSAEGQYNLGNALAKLNQFEAAKSAYERALVQNPQLKAAEQNRDLMAKLLAQMPQGKQGAQNSAQQNGQNSANQADGASQAENSAQNETTQTGQPDQTDQADAASRANAPANQPNSDLDERVDRKSQKQAQQNEQALEQADKFAKQQAEQAEQQAEKNPQQSEQTAALDSAQKSTQTQAGKPSSPSKLGSPESDLDKHAQLVQQEASQAKQAWIQQIPDEPGLFLKRKFDYQYQQSVNKDSPKKSW